MMNFPQKLHFLLRDPRSVAESIGEDEYQRLIDTLAKLRAESGMDLVDRAEQICRDFDTPTETRGFGVRTRGEYKKRGVSEPGAVSTSADRIEEFANVLANSWVDVTIGLRQKISQPRSAAELLRITNRQPDPLPPDAQP